MSRLFFFPTAFEEFQLTNKELQMAFILFTQVFSVHSAISGAHLSWCWAGILHTQLLSLFTNYCSLMHHPENVPQWAFCGGVSRNLTRNLEKTS